FGLLHGLGFASALGELALPEGSELTALLFFNLGVEIGQITVLLTAYLVFGWLQRWPLYRRRVAEPASMTIAGLGLYWLIKRLAY
ncbi:MAG: HupE/UreJ family protein, partial [Pseudomonadota bacterium]|nr:HupE/UreJ family protein [Pseudomonadota bacterium]